MIQYDMLLEQLRRSWYDSRLAYARVAITMALEIFCLQFLKINPLEGGIDSLFFPGGFQPLQFLATPSQAFSGIGRSLHWYHLFLDTQRSRRCCRIRRCSSPLQICVLAPLTGFDVTDNKTFFASQDSGLQICEVVDDSPIGRADREPLYLLQPLITGP
jgi:hypothetical protein